jgi:hypothetical protein
MLLLNSNKKLHSRKNKLKKIEQLPCPACARALYPLRPIYPPVKGQRKTAVLTTQLMKFNAFLCDTHRREIEEEAATELDPLHSYQWCRAVTLEPYPLDDFGASLPPIDYSKARSWRKSISTSMAYVSTSTNHRDAVSRLLAPTKPQTTNRALNWNLDAFDNIDDESSYNFNRVEVTPPITIKRGRGRPRKVLTVEEITAAAMPKKRGRPRKLIEASEVPALPKKRGRPRKNLAVSPTSFSATNAVPTQPYSSPRCYSTTTLFALTPAFGPSKRFYHQHGGPERQHNNFHSHPMQRRSKKPYVKKRGGVQTQKKSCNPKKRQALLNAIVSRYHTIISTRRAHLVKLLTKVVKQSKRTNKKFKVLIRRQVLEAAYRRRRQIVRTRRYLAQRLNTPRSAKCRAQLSNLKQYYKFLRKPRRLRKLTIKHEKTENREPLNFLIRRYVFLSRSD